MLLRMCIFFCNFAAESKFVHNPEGYIRYLTAEEHYHFYYIKDLLGNVRETYVHPEAGYKECVQRTQYYPSGLPWWGIKAMILDYHMVHISHRQK